MSGRGQTIALLCILLFLGGCKNPFIDRILGSKVNKDEEDFGPGASVIVLNVYNAGDWTTITNTGLGTPIDDGGNNKNYIINIMADVVVTPSLNVPTPTGIKVSIRGNGALIRNGTGNLLTVAASQTFILRSPLRGAPGSMTALVNVNGSLIMRDGALITGHSNGSASGGGVALSAANSIFTMYGGTISGNSASLGGGVYVTSPSARFTMHGGTISGNTVSLEGGGVAVNIGTFTMYGGTISGNRAGTNGGGVFIGSTGYFTKTGGIIYGSGSGGNSNTAMTGPSFGHAAFYNYGPIPIDYTLEPRVSGFVRW